MNLIAAVYSGLKRKRSAESEAIRLEISLKDYLKIKQIILSTIEQHSDQIDDFIIAEAEGSTSEKLISSNQAVTKVHEIHEDLETGTAKITAVAFEEPRSAEEIIKVLNIDTTRWKLSQYWNKEKGSRWLVSALITRLPEEQQAQISFLELLQSYKIPKIPAPETRLIDVTSHKEEVCGVFSLQDLHFGKTGNEDMGKILNDAVHYLIGKAHASYRLGKLVMVVGPDTLNMDTFGGTTTKGTPVENSESAPQAYLKAFDSICESIITISSFAPEIEVIFIPGNHDRLSSFHLLHAVSQAFSGWKHLKFNIDYAERKVITYGTNMLCFEHGDVHAKNNPLVFAVEFAKQWGECSWRMLYTGHYHGRKAKEYVTENEEHGFITRIIPALTSSDYYHYHNKYVGNKRSALLHIHEQQQGLIGEFTYSV
jgi:hypothetical protein